jgi:hypothetical protein
MSILIKGMEMPKEFDSDVYIELACGVDGNRYARLYNYHLGGLTEWCEIVPLPPHGRLGDLDALIQDLKYDVELDADALDSMEIVGDERRKIQDDKDFKQNCIFLIGNAPIVIEAEEVSGNSGELED